AGNETQVFRHARLIFDTPDTPIADFVAAEQAVERLRDSFVDYFQRYDVLLGPVTPFPATKHGLDDLVVDGKTVSAFHVMRAASPFNLTGMPGFPHRVRSGRDRRPVRLEVGS